jgi:acetyl-CoA acetyltransferase
MTTSKDAFICDAVRTPIGRYAGALSSVRTDDLAAAPISALMARNPQLDWARLDDVVLGCANQAGEDNRDVARMAALLAGLPVEVGGATVNRLSVPVSRPSPRRRVRSARAMASSISPAVSRA